MPQPSTIVALQIIYDAYDRVYDIASHRWHPYHYYSPEFKVSNLFGHYVRALLADRAPESITYDEYTRLSQPLRDAIDLVLLEILRDSDPVHDGIVSIVEGRSLIFRQESTYGRTMAVFNLIEHTYPRAEHRDGAKPSHRRTPKKNHSRSLSSTRDHSRSLAPPSDHPHKLPTTTWKPYKDD